MRKTGLDFLKFLCSFLVVCIHRPFPNLTGSVVTTIATMAVPVFFMVTGYFYSEIKDHGRELAQIKKIGTYFLYANGLFFLLKISDYFLAHKTLTGFLSNDFAPNAFWNFLFLNESPFHGHLWYLGSILYVLIIVFLVDKLWGRQKLYAAIPLLLSAGMILGKYSVLICGRDFSNFLSRNFIFLGLPYFLIGDILSHKKAEWKGQHFIWLIGIFAFTASLEHFLLKAFGVNAAGDHYLSTTFLSVCTFLFALNTENRSENRLYQWCCFIGRKLTFNIYILHPIFAAAFVRALPFIHNAFVKTALCYISPFLVFGLSLAVSWILYAFGTLLQKR